MKILGADQFGRARIPLLTTLSLYALCYLIGAVGFDVWISPRAIAYDLLLQLIFGHLLFMLSRHASVYVALHGLIMLLLYGGNAIKLAFFGGPIVPDDVSALPALLLILDGWRFLAATISLAAILGLLLFNLRVHHRESIQSLAGLTLIAVVVIYSPQQVAVTLDHHFGNSVWDQRSNYIQRGATLYTLQEGARFLADPDPVPQVNQARMAAALLGESTLVRSDRFKGRNVHMVVMESFWDPDVLKNAQFSEPPLSPEFRALWKQAGFSRVMSPVFGGYTANAEFEALCGFPVDRDNVKFERHLSNQVPCMPRLFAERGYHTIASHPNVPVFWNRINAYRRIGFQTYWSLRDFQQDDMNDEFLADASLYRQVSEKITPLLEEKKPIFNYILTYAGHWGYPLNENRPPRITTSSSIEEVGKYANAVYYSSRELMAFLNALQKKDPDGLIVVFGDHLPFLGENFAGYVESGLLTSTRSDFTPEMFKLFSSTPLLLIDGRNGPLRLGTIPLYALPRLLLELLNHDRPSIMQYVRQPYGMQVRPLPGMHFNLLQDGSIVLCKEPPFTTDCEISQQWLSQIKVVGNDLFVGRQATLPEAHTPELEIISIEDETMADNGETSG